MNGQQAPSNGLDVLDQNMMNGTDEDLNPIDTQSVGNGDMMEDDNDLLDDELQDEGEEEEEYKFKDFRPIRKAMECEQSILNLLDIGMNVIETLVNATKENYPDNQSKEQAKQQYSQQAKAYITNYYETLAKLKKKLAKQIALASRFSSLNCEISTYTERKTLEIENKKQRLFKLESLPSDMLLTNIPVTTSESKVFDDLNSVNMDNISQSNISSTTNSIER